MEAKAQSYEERMKWFHEARFGMFIHWGLYSLLGRGEWVMLNERIPAREYAKLANRFNPTRFDADAWAGLASALERVVAGERDEESLIADLGLGQSMILETILRGLADPSTLEEMQKNWELKRIPIIVISNSGQPVELDRAQKLGAKDWLVKTEFDPQEVINKVIKQIGK